MATVTVRIPSVFRTLTSNIELVPITAVTVSDLIEVLEKTYPGTKARICDDSGKIRKAVNLFVGEEDIRFLDGPNTVFKDGDAVDIVPAIAGG